MDWFYEKNGKQNGPVEVSELTRMLDAGDLSLDSLVWHDGMDDWKPMGEADVLRNESGEGMAVCAYSGEVKVKSEMVPYGDRWVSPEHKEAFVQQLMEGTQFKGGGDVADYQVNISQHFGQAWKLLTEDFWPIIGVSAAVFAGYMAASQVPLAGALAGFVATPLFAGLFYYMLLKVRGQTARIEDSLAGFKRNFLQLFLLGIIQMIIVWASMIPGGLVLVGGVVAIEGVSEVAGITIIVVGVVLAILPAVYLSTVWMFSNWLCIDREMDFWPSMTVSMKAVNKHWFGCFLFALVMGAINMTGALVFCVGIFFAFPFTVLALAFFYEDVFGRERVNTLESRVD